MFELTINITETTCFALFRMMETPGPIYSDIALPSVEACCSLHTSTSADTTELEQAVKDWAIVTHVVFSLLLGERVHIIRGDFLEEVDVFIGVELGHFMTSGRFRALRNY